MELIDSLRALSARIPNLKQTGVIKTEEGTKNALVMPFINALGYNVFDPLEVTPELNADFGTKKGEKVDYAILRDGKPIILFECKALGTNLQLVHAAQLYRYFSVTNAIRFGILTDGLKYRFFSDLVEKNKMDQNPFFIFDLEDVDEASVEELKKFTKAAYDETTLISAASQLKYRNLVHSYLAKQIDEKEKPSDEFIKVIAQESSAYQGRFTQPILEEFRVVIRDALRSFIDEGVNKQIKSLVAGAAAAQKAESAAPAPTKAASVTTTEEEMSAYLIIKAILSEVADVKRITMRDAQSYCAILVDDNNRRTIARLYFGPKRHSIGIFNVQKQEQDYPINNLDDIFKYAAALKEAIGPYISEPTE